MENFLGVYSNYLDHLENIDVDYQMNMAMVINKNINANFGINNLLYDDDALQDIQLKEVFGLGFNAKF